MTELLYVTLGILAVIVFIAFLGGWAAREMDGIPLFWNLRDHE